jgi:hypothetical protein
MKSRSKASRDRPETPHNSTVIWIRRRLECHLQKRGLVCSNLGHSGDSLESLEDKQVRRIRFDRAVDISEY